MIPFHIPTHNELQQMLQRQDQQNRIQQQQQQDQNRAQQRVLYTTNRNLAAPENPENRDRIVVVVEPGAVQQFVKRVYLIAIIWICIACHAWAAIILTEFNFEKATKIPRFVWLMLAFFFIMTMVCLPELNYVLPPCGVIMTLFIVFFIILAGSYLVLGLTIKQFIVGILVTMLTLAALYSYGAMAPQQCIPSVNFLVLLFIILTIVLSAQLIIMPFVKSPTLYLAFLLLFFLFILLSTIFNSQYIHGRFDIVPLNDALHCALSIFIQFSFLMFLIEHAYRLTCKLNA